MAVENSSTDGVPMQRAKFKFTRCDQYEANCLTKQHEAEEEIAISDTSSVITISGLSSARLRVREYLDERCLKSRGSEALVLRDCSACEIFVDIPMGAVHMVNLHDCQVALAAIKGSVHARNTRSTSMQGFCGQLRITDSETLTLGVQTQSSTALANCRDIRVVHPPDISSDGAFEACLETAGMLNDEYVHSDKWRNIKDFDCLSGSSPNWSFC